MNSATTHRHCVYLVLCIGTAVLATNDICKATLIAYESFNYESGSIGGNGSASDDGWTGSWTNGTYTVNSTSLMLPNNPLPTAGGHVEGTSTTNRDFDQIDFSTPGVYFVSYLARHEGFDINSSSNQFLELHLRSGFTQKVKSGMTSGLEFFVNDVAGANTDETTGDIAANDNVYFFVQKLTVGPGAADDSLQLAVYDDGLDIPVSEPSTWLLNLSGADFTGNVNKLTLWSGTRAGFSSSFDEIRLATSWEDAAPVSVPEPATAFLLVMGALLTTRVRRNRLGR